MAIPQQWLDELRDKISLSTLVGADVKLTRAGREWKGCCPIHNEKTASFYVNDDKGFVHCFGCSFHGDAIKWMTDFRGFTFMEAVRELAGIAGMEVPNAYSGRTREDERKPIFDVVERAARLFEGQVRGGADYMQSRGISQATAREFRIGFATGDRQNLRTALKDAGDELLTTAGLITSKEDGEPYDKFRNRLIFPIQDKRGRVVGFGGRAMGDVEPKYLNSPETPIFTKGKLLFNAHRAVKFIRAADRLLVVEGYMDVIALHQVGVGEAIAPNGTAVTAEQLNIMWQMFPEPTFLLDGDKAGKKAMIRAALTALPMVGADRRLRFAKLPDGMDPDDVVKRDGIAGISEACAGSINLADCLYAHALESNDTRSPEGRAKMMTMLQEWVGQIGDDMVRQNYADEFRSRFEDQFPRPPAEPVRQTQPRYNRKTKRAPTTNQARRVARGGIAEIMDRSLLVGLSRFPQVMVDLCELVARMRPVDEEAVTLWGRMVDGAMEGKEKLLDALSARDTDLRIRQLEARGLLPFSFLSIDTDPADAQRALEQAVIAKAEAR